MARKKIEKEVNEEVKTDVPSVVPQAVPTVSHKQHLLDLYQELKDLGVRSISDLENLIARAE